MGIEAVRRVDLTYCVDILFLTTKIDSCLDANVSSKKELTNDVLCAQIHKRAPGSRTTVTIFSSDSILKRELKIGMKNFDARACLYNHLVNFQSFLATQVCHGYSIPMQRYPHHMR